MKNIEMFWWKRTVEVDIANLMNYLDNQYFSQFRVAICSVEKQLERLRPEPGNRPAAYEVSEIDSIAVIGAAALVYNHKRFIEVIVLS